MLGSFELENNHENVEEQEDNPFDYFLQSTAWLPFYYKHLSRNTADNSKELPTCVWQRYDSQYCLQIKDLTLPIEIKYKNENRTLSIIPTKKKTRVEFLMNRRLDTKCNEKHPEFSGNCQHLVQCHNQ
jgi:hypothetical protein